MVTKDGAKMSKSRGNVVSPASIVDRVGADTARSYILFVGPPEQDADWSDEGVDGRLPFPRAAVAPGGRGRRTARRLGRSDEPPQRPQGEDLALARKTHWAIEKVGSDVRRFSFNTAIAAVMELYNECSRLREVAELQTLRFAVASAASLLFPFAPHVSADIYERLTGERVWEQPWPDADEALLETDSYELVCQVNGKVRDRVQARTDAPEQELKELCLAAANVRAHVDGREIVKEIVLPGKLVNLVVR